MTELLEDRFREVQAAKVGEYDVVSILADRGTFSTKDWIAAIRGGEIFRESNMAFGSEYRFGESFRGGHGSEIHLIQGLVAADALEREFGAGTFKKVLTGPMMDNYENWWSRGFEAGGINSGMGGRGDWSFDPRSMLFPSLRASAQIWGIFPWVK